MLDPKNYKTELLLTKAYRDQVLKQTEELPGSVLYDLYCKKSCSVSFYSLFLSKTIEGKVVSPYNSFQIQLETPICLKTENDPDFEVVLESAVCLKKWSFIGYKAFHPAGEAGVCLKDPQLPSFSSTLEDSTCLKESYTVTFSHELQDSTCLKTLPSFNSTLSDESCLKGKITMSSTLANDVCLKN